MSIEEKLSKLNPKVSSWGDSGSGSFGGMTVSDLAASLAGCNPLGELILWRRYIDDTCKPDGYYRLLKDVILDIYKRERPKTKGLIAPLYVLALEDYLGSLNCPVCDGRSEMTLSNGLNIKCDHKPCIEGKVRYQDKDRAKALKVSMREYINTYKDTYDKIEKYITRVLPEEESKAINHVKKQANWDD